MTSPLPPKRRDTRDSADLIRQLKQNARQLGGGFVGGRFPPAKPLGATAQVGDLEDDGQDEILLWEWNDRHTITGTGTQRPRLTYAPVDEALTVFWHPGGHGGLPLTNEMFTVDDKIVTIPDSGYFAVGDTFSFQYPHLDEEPEPIDPSLVGFTVPGSFDLPTKKLTFTLPPGTAADDLLVMAVRGGVGAGAGELCSALSCADARMSLAFEATRLVGSQTIIQSIWVGVATGSSTPIVVDVTEWASLTPFATGDLVAITGANGFGAPSSVESGSTTPVVAGVAAIASVWDGNHSFALITDITPPTGYTETGDSSNSTYSATDLAFWYDPDGTTSPAGTFVGQGCCVIPII